MSKSQEFEYMVFIVLKNSENQKKKTFTERKNGGMHAW